MKFARITGWRVASEVLSLEWRRVDFKAGNVTLDPGTTKNGDPRTCPMTPDLRQLLEGQHGKHLEIQQAGQLCRAGVSRTVAMQLVGHRTEGIYDRYNITSGADLREAARKLHASMSRGAHQPTANQQ